MNRRQFMEKSVAAGAALSLFPSLPCGGSQTPDAGEIPKRSLGRTGENLSIIGFGGILVSGEEQKTANDLVAKAFARGINYYDVAPTYGNAQDRLGPALKPYRSKSFLACKTTQREKAGAERELNESLQKLQTDHFDLYQLHAIKTREDVETAFAPNGAMEVFLQAKKEGKVRFLGFSAHSEEAALLAMEKFDFDTILFPINFVCWHQGNFGPKVVAKAVEKKMGILALKGLAYARLGKNEKNPYKKCWYRPAVDDKVADLGLRFTLSQPTTSAVTPGESVFLWKAAEIAARFRPLNDEETVAVQKLSQGVEPIFKTT